jgi:ribonucleoside-triphosphate reductase
MAGVINGTGERTRCEIYSRVVGYIRPVNQWNEGKQSEYADRVEFSGSACGCE